jgi:hypothetical protein
MNVNETTYKNYGKCLRVDNGIVELIVPLEFGIRILGFGPAGGRNVFAELPDMKVAIEGKEWRFYGGHRLWLSPETNKTYFPDNEPITYSVQGDALRLVQPLDAWSGVVKEIEIVLSDGKVELIHRATNEGSVPEKLALWAISVMAAGGVEVIPLKGKETGWLHNRQLSLWPYTRMNDTRIRWFDDYLTLSQDPNKKEPVKLGFSNREGWGLYVNQGLGFIKKYKPIDDVPYPDNNVWYETYTCDSMLEMETLSPIRETEPGGSVEHVEEWSVFETEDLDASANSSIAAFIEGIKDRLE